MTLTQSDQGHSCAREVVLDKLVQLGNTQHQVLECTESVYERQRRRTSAGSVLTWSDWMLPTMWSGQYRELHRAFL